MTIQHWSDDILLAELQDDPILSEDLSAVIEQLGDQPKADVVLDFSSVNFVNSSNIAKLLKLRKFVMINGRRKMQLCGINSHVWGVFLITGLDKLFQFSDNVALGLAAIQISDE